MEYKYHVEKLPLRPFFFLEKKDYWCVVRTYKEQVYHYYWGYKYIDKKDIMYRFETQQEALSRLGEIK